MIKNNVPFIFFVPENAKIVKMKTVLFVKKVKVI